MARIEIYTTAYCPYCIRAKMLLSQKQARFEEIAIDGDADKRRAMMARARRHTVPQIFIDDAHIGGCDELYALERDGQLDALLGDTEDLRAQ